MGAGLARVPRVRVIAEPPSYIGTASRVRRTGGRVRYVVMRPGVIGRPKPSSEAEQQYEADVALAGRRAELLDAAREAEAGSGRRRPGTPRTPRYAAWPRTSMPR